MTGELRKSGSHKYSLGIHRQQGQCPFEDDQDHEGVVAISNVTAERAREVVSEDCNLFAPPPPPPWSLEELREVLVCMRSRVSLYRGSEMIARS